ncbi:MAG: tagatose 1,6-diphosphate aldolase [Chloroflexi bacterium]|nr:tagatose 1,6-diphosphate aldolase [Chloroflexota bacterium]
MPMMKKLTIGKLRGLQQIASEDGIFVICAIDHRESFRNMIGGKNPEGVSTAEMTVRKMELCSTLGRYGSAVLLDPIFGAAQCIAGGALPRDAGLLVSIEASGYGGGKENRRTELLNDWGVEKIKRMGASAVKILLYYRPDLKPLAGEQLAIISQVAQDCIEYDIPFLVEPVSYPVGSEISDPEKFAAIKGKLVIQTARDITALPIDVLKAEFPADLRYEKDRSRLIELCRQLDAASRVPWVILSAGVDFETFLQQVEIACQAGASGFLGGRAIWQEVVSLAGAAARVEWLSTVGADRLKRLVEVANRYATPWYRKRGLETHELAEVSEDWYREY